MHYYNQTPEQVGEIRCGAYNIMLSQVFNLRSFNKGQKLELKTTAELIQSAIDMGIFKPKRK